MIIDGSNNLSDEKVEDSFLRKIRSKAAQEEFNDFYKQWFDSSKAVSDVESEANQICKIIDERFYPYQNDYSSQGISLVEKIYYRSIENDLFGCRIELKNSPSARHLNESPYKIFLDLTLFQKVFITPEIRYPDDLIINMSFYPDVNFERDVIWRNSRDENNIFTSKKLADEFFKLFINQLEEYQGNKPNSEQ